VPELAGVMAYGANEGEAVAKAESLALRVLADRLTHDTCQGTLRARSGPAPIVTILDKRYVSASKKSPEQVS
jgi:hypothetical protein